jgi:hypothetical protein
MPSVRLFFFTNSEFKGDRRNSGYFRVNVVKGADRNPLNPAKREEGVNARFFYFFKEFRGGLLSSE